MKRSMKRSMKRPMKRMVCTVFAALVVVGGLAACGSGVGGGGADPAAAINETPAVPTGIGGGFDSADDEFCALIQAINGPDYEEAIARGRQADPPADLEAVWDDYLDGTAAVNALDFSDTELMDRYGVAMGVAAAWLFTNCEFTY